MAVFCFFVFFFPLTIPCYVPGIIIISDYRMDLEKLSSEKNYRCSLVMDGVML